MKADTYRELQEIKRGQRLIISLLLKLVKQDETDKELTLLIADAKKHTADIATALAAASGQPSSP